MCVYLSLPLGSIATWLKAMYCWVKNRLVLSHHVLTLLIWNCLRRLTTSTYRPTCIVGCVNSTQSTYSGTLFRFWVPQLEYYGCVSDSRDPYCGFLMVLELQLLKQVYFGSCLPTVYCYNCQLSDPSCRCSVWGTSHLRIGTATRVHRSRLSLARVIWWRSCFRGHHKLGTPSLLSIEGRRYLDAVLCAPQVENVATSIESIGISIGWQSDSVLVVLCLWLDVYPSTT